MAYAKVMGGEKGMDPVRGRRNVASVQLDDMAHRVRLGVSCRFRDIAGSLSG